MRRAKQLLFFEPLLWQILSAIRRCIGRASQRVWVYSDQTSRCRGDLLRLPLRKVVVVARVFLTFLIWEAFVGVGTSMFSNIFDASAALPGDGYTKGPRHHVRHHRRTKAVAPPSATRSN